MADRLFVYGTLHPSHAPQEIADLVGKFQSVGSGRVRGRLYDLGDYPALVLSESAYFVKGEIFLLPSDPDVLARLDAYEEFSPEFPDASLFLRKRTKVTMEDGSSETCWIYVYNQPIPAELSEPKFASVA